jgi:hypothetical protein
MENREPEKTKDITTEMRDPHKWWSRYHGNGADCDVLDTDAMLKSYADRIDSSSCELLERIREAEDVIHKLAEVAGKLDAAGGSEASLVNLCQRCRGQILDTLMEYWRKHTGGSYNAEG